MSGEDLPDKRLDRLIEITIMEDAALGDLTSEAIIPEDLQALAELLCKGEGVIAGLGVAAKVFKRCDPGCLFERSAEDGDRVQPGDIVARVQGSARGILLAERTALNFLQRMSGIATLTRRYVDAVEGTGVRITDTRKTAPGLRGLDKRAVVYGGGTNHRFGLDDMVLIKDNHIVAAGGVAAAVRACCAYLERQGINVAVEVETKSLDEIREALSVPGVTRIMLDNFPIEEIHAAVQLIDHRVEVEASGGVTLESVRSIAETGVDLISVGALTHSAKALDISLELSQHV